MFICFGTTYISGVVIGVSKKVTRLLTRSIFTKEENEYAERNVGRLDSCRPVESVFSKDAIQKLKKMLKTSDLRGLYKLARDETLRSEDPLCVDFVIVAIASVTRRLPSIVHETTIAYIYGEL